MKNGQKYKKAEFEKLLVLRGVCCKSKARQYVKENNKPYYTEDDVAEAYRATNRGDPFTDDWQSVRYEWGTDIQSGKLDKYEVDWWEVYAYRRNS